MKIQLERKEQYTLVKLDEEKLESNIAPDLKSELVYLNAEGVRNIILDLSQVKYADSSGLSAILVGNRICSAANGSFILAGVQSNVMKLIEISQLETILTLIPTVDEAIDYVFIEEIERGLGEG